MTTSLFINHQAALTNFCQKIAGAPFIAVDTEFLREKTYYPKLCLIQIATDNEIACIDPLALDDLTPILNVIYHPNITVVFHAARQDLEVLYLTCQALPNNLFDTQLAAALLGYGEQIGYGSLVKQCLDIDLNKTHARTDWTKRPLADAALRYASNDVRYLRDVYTLILKELKQKNRLHWLDDTMRTLLDESTYQPCPDSAWQKVKGYHQLKGIELAILQKLAAWRERYAMQSDRPRRWIIRDNVLLTLAKTAPDNQEALKFIHDLKVRTRHRHGNAILAAIKAAKRAQKQDWPTLKITSPLTKPQQANVLALMLLLRKFCDKHTISPVAIATRKDIERLVMGNTDLALLQGWRYKLVGHYLQEYLHNKPARNVSLT